MNESKVRMTQMMLKYVFGAVLVVIGLDKLFRTDLLADWPMYVSEPVAAMLPFSVGVFLAILAIAEIIVGGMILWKWTRLGAYIAAAVLVLIAINLLMLGFVDIAARDIVIAVAAVALAWLTEAMQGASAPARQEQLDMA